MENTCLSSWAKQLLLACRCFSLIPVDTTQGLLQICTKDRTEKENSSQQSLWKSASPKHYWYGLHREPHHDEADTRVPGSSLWWPPSPCGRKHHRDLTWSTMKHSLAAWWSQRPAGRRHVNCRFSREGTEPRLTGPRAKALAAQLVLVLWSHPPVL